ncbi:MAG: peptidoglycan DD-metalloendopeptidase family protein [Anaerolineae bacterium]
MMRVRIYRWRLLFGAILTAWLVSQGAVLEPAPLDVRAGGPPGLPVLLLDNNQFVYPPAMEPQPWPARLDDRAGKDEPVDWGGRRLSRVAFLDEIADANNLNPAILLALLEMKAVPARPDALYQAAQELQARYARAYFNDFDGAGSEVRSSALYRALQGGRINAASYALLAWADSRPEVAVDFSDGEAVARFQDLLNRYGVSTPALASAQDVEPGAASGQPVLSAPWNDGGDWYYYTGMYYQGGGNHEQNNAIDFDPPWNPALDCPNNWPNDRPDIYSPYYVTSMTAGTVVDIRYDRTKIQADNGWFLVYEHVADDHLVVSLGQRVEIGQAIGYTACVGYTTSIPHLHWHIYDASNQPVRLNQDGGLEVFGWRFDTDQSSTLRRVGDATVSGDGRSITPFVTPFSQTMPWPPYGNLTAPSSGAVLAGTTTQVGGWAKVTNSSINRVQVWVDGVYRGDATYGVYSAEAGGNYGFEWTWNTALETDGTHTVLARYYADNGGFVERTARVTVLSGLTPQAYIPIVMD